MMNDPNVMGWNDVLKDDGKEPELLAEGDYTFTVTAFERGEYAGGPKIPPCPKASITLAVDREGGEVVTVRMDLLLYRTLEWKLTSFCRSIGLRKEGDEAVPEWEKVVGSRGKAHFKPRQYTTRDGEVRTVNDVARFIDYTPEVAMTQVQMDEEVPW